MNQMIKILVIEDEKNIRNFISSVLTSQQYQVISSSTGRDGLSQAASQCPDLILLDYEMPVCDGKQVLEMIRSDKDIADIPVIFLTGRGDAESVKKVMSLRPEGYLLKTMPEENIKKTIDDFFAKRKKDSGK